MPRRPKIRVSFYDDAQFLLRLALAIERDKALPKDWRKKTQEKIRELHITLMTAPPRKEEV